MKTEKVMFFFAIACLCALTAVVFITGHYIREAEVKTIACKATLSIAELEIKEVKESCTEEHRILVQGLDACIQLRALEATPLFSNNPEITEMIDDFYTWESKVEAAKKAVHIGR
jgi:hypothetical protein